MWKKKRERGFTFYNGIREEEILIAPCVVLGDRIKIQEISMSRHPFISYQIDRESHKYFFSRK